MGPTRAAMQQPSCIRELQFPRSQAEKPGVLFMKPPVCKEGESCRKLSCKEILMPTEMPGPILGSFHLSPSLSFCFQKALLGTHPWSQCSALSVTDRSGKTVSRLGESQQQNTCRSRGNKLAASKGKHAVCWCRGAHLLHYTSWG